MNILETKGYINGEWVSSSTKASFPVFNPATRELLAEVQNFSEVEAEVAVKAGKVAFQAWHKLPTTSRVKALYDLSEELKSNDHSLAKLITKESGKPYKQAKVEVDSSLNMIHWLAAEAMRQQGRTLPIGSNKIRHMIIKQPIGLVFAITPWNFPLMAIVVKCAAAIAAGCTVILKPSEETPLTALALAHMAERAELPKGIFQVLPSNNPASISKIMYRCADVRLISFTGSTKVAREIMEKSSQTLKKVSFECGGNAPFIVFEDVDIKKVIKSAVNSRFYNNGQVCIGANRFLVHDEIFDDFYQQLKEEVNKLQVGNPESLDTNIGPLINAQAIKNIQCLLFDAEKKGAKVFIGGKMQEQGDLFFAPRIVSEVTSDMDIFHEEIFGPVACLSRFSDEESVIQVANNTPYGLAAYAFTENSNRLWRLGERLAAGMVGLNGTDICGVDLPFGGIKQSGLAREGGVGCLDEFVETKNLSFHLGGE